MPECSPKQAVFAREWIKDHNGAQAAVRAGYSRNGAKEAGSRLLTYDNVKAEIARIEAHRDTETVGEAVDKRAEALKDIDEGLIAAKDAANLGARARFTELKLRSMGMLSDKVIIEDAKTEEIKANERDEIAAQADQRIIQLNQETG